jgi:hypothetical protein
MKTLLFLALFVVGGSCFAQTTAPTTRPAVPIGSFFQPIRNLDLLKSLGVTVFYGPEVENPKGHTPESMRVARLTWIAAATDRGTVVLKSPTPEELALAGAKCVGLLLDIDEPNGKGKTAADLKDNFDRLRALDPSKPVFLSLAGDKVTSANFNRANEFQLYKDFASVCDVFTVNAYSMNRNASRYPTTWTGDAVKKLEPFGKPVWAWVEHNDQRLPDPKPADGINREPTPEEIKATVDYALAQGAVGIGWFSTCDSGKYGWPQSYLPMVNRKGESMAPQFAMMAQIAGVVPPPATQPSTQPSTTRPADPDLAALRGEVSDLRTRLDVLRSNTAAAVADLKAQTDASTAFLNAVRAAATQPTTQRTQQP